MNKLKKLKFLFFFAFLINSGGAFAVERLSMTPGGAVIYGTRVYSGVSISAYQQPYAMNFEIWKPQDLPSGWYATFDGFPVAQIAENRWVYGQIVLGGVIRPTNILVGSVIPDRVPELARIASGWSYGKYVNSPEFLKIRDYRCNRMGWLDLDKYNASTLIAWHTNKIGVWIWLGNRWKRLTPNSGEYTWQMIKRLIPYITDELKKANFWYYGGEPFEAADLTRQWGWIWGGRVVLESLNAYEDSGGNDGVTSLNDSSNGDSPEEESSSRSSGQWDVD